MRLIIFGTVFNYIIPADPTVSIIPDGPTYIHQRSDYANYPWSVVLGTDKPDSLPVSVIWTDNLGTKSHLFVC